MNFLALFSVLILTSCLMRVESRIPAVKICNFIGCRVSPCKVMRCAAGTVCVSKCPCEGACVAVEKATEAPIV